MASVGGVILAGGKSLRMGAPKAFLEIDCEYFISRIHRTLSSIFDSIMIIEAERSMKYSFLTEHVFADVYKDHGPLGGIHSAFVNSRNDLLFFASCDIPMLTVGIVDKIVAAYRGCDAVVPRTADGIHPLCALYRRDCLPKIDVYLKSGGRSVNAFLKQIDVRYIEVSRDEAPSLSNVNTPEEYRALIES